MVEAEQQERKEAEQRSVPRKLDLLNLQVKCLLSPTSAIFCFMRENETMIKQCEDSPTNLKKMVQDLKAAPGAAEEIHERIKMEQFKSNKKEVICNFILWKYANLPIGMVNEANIQ